MHMEQLATVAALSDGRVTSEPKTRKRLIWRNVPGADQILDSTPNLILVEITMTAGN